MLAKLNRIRKKRDFELIFTKGKSLRDKILSARILKNNLQESRFGFVISKKISTKAVVRNKVRRRLSEIIRLNVKKMEKNTDVVFIALPGIEKKSFLETEEIVKNILKKAGLLNV